MNTEQKRAEFEAWLRVKPCGAAHDFAWEAWQAALASPEVQALRDLLDEAYAELLAESHRDGPKCLLLTRIEAALAAMEKQK